MTTFSNGVPGSGPMPALRRDYRHRIASAIVAVSVAFGMTAPAVAQSSSSQASAQEKKAGQSKSARHKVIFQVSDGDPKKWGLTLNNARNVQAELGAANVDIEIVAYGPGIDMLKADSEIANRVEGDALSKGIKVVACENTMTNQKISRADMLSGISYVRAGVVELMIRQKQGYAYIRP